MYNPYPRDTALCGELGKAGLLAGTAMGTSCRDQHEALNFSQLIRRSVGGESGSVCTESPNRVSCVWVFFLIIHAGNFQEISHLRTTRSAVSSRAVLASMGGEGSQQSTVMVGTWQPAPHGPVG